MSKYLLPILFFLMACEAALPDDSRFVLKDQTGINFNNALDYTEEVNPYTFKNFYNGGGVGIGDINNDGLPDVFFSGNLVSNRLYLNKGNLQFEDITEEAGLLTEGVWTTGVSLVDINHDGFLDIYICKSGPPGGADRANALYINNQNLSFSEEAKAYGLDNVGLSTHASFFDYDQDGDLDCYLLNNSIRSVGGYDLIEGQREIPDTLGGNKLLRNDDDFFTDVSQSSGIYSSAIGFGLGVTISDINQDGWLDIYVSNDFFEKDYLYINQSDGTFNEELEAWVTEMSMGSMGADIADLTNDGENEIFVTEMLPFRHDRVMSKASFETWDRYQLEIDRGYYRQFARNALQLNNGDGSFSEISRLAGVEATDWSWGALIFDMDNDGWNDLFVANGINKDLLDQDYINFMAQPEAIRKMLQEDGKAIKKLVDMIPSESLPNSVYKNKGGLEFENVGLSWGFTQNTFSNGSAYGDLDNDGDLDLVINNADMQSFIYENRTSELDSVHWLGVDLKGRGKNTFAIGSKVILYIKNGIQVRELTPMRGFQSSIDYRIYFGLGRMEAIDSLRIVWPDQTTQLIPNPKPDQLLTIVFQSDLPGFQSEKSKPDLLFETVPVGQFPYTHEENSHVDFDRDRLLLEMNSNEGPCGCSGDINGDGLIDIYIGGAKGQSGQLFLRQADGSYVLSQSMDRHQSSEDTDCILADFNNDGWLDLMVASGGSEFSSFSLELRDRLYINRSGTLHFKEDAGFNSLISTGAIAASDIDGDGYLDVFVGERLKSQAFGVPAGGYIYMNQSQGIFAETQEVPPSFSDLGLITDAKWGDIDSDGDEDLVICGQWRSIAVYKNQDGRLVRSIEAGFADSNGDYRALSLTDLDKDGDLDIIAGNHGLNSRIRASKGEPIRIYVNDFDGNGSIEQLYTKYRGGKYYPLVQLKDLTKQLPGLKKKVLRYEDYKQATMDELFDEALLSKSITYDIYDLETAVYENDGSGIFTKTLLPIEVQISNVFAIHTGDYNQDGLVDFILAGNQHRSKPEMGIYAASYGQVFLRNASGGYDFLEAGKSGISTRGEVREIVELQNELLFLKSDSKPFWVSY